MTDKAAERAAMLAKIKANMAATKEKMAASSSASTSATADRAAAREAMLAKIKAAKEKALGGSTASPAAQPASTAAASESGSTAAPAAEPKAAAAVASAVEPAAPAVEKKEEVKVPEEKKEEKKEEKTEEKTEQKREEEKAGEAVDPNDPAAVAEAEKQEMLRKIRQDMEDTRARLKKMKERQSVLFPETSADVPAKVVANKPKIVRVKKAGDSASPKIIRRDDARRPSIDTRRPSIAGPDVRRPSIGGPDARRPSIGGPDARRPSVGSKAEKQRKQPTGKNIRSLADLQKAIKKADRVKKQAQTTNKIEGMKREKQKETLTKEEKKLIRASRRMTMELQSTEARVKVDQQINGFMKMMSSLENEWQKMEDTRVKREQEMEAQRVCFEQAGESMAFLTTTVQDLVAQMEHLKVVIDRVVENTPKAAKKDEKWASQLTNFHESFLSMRHQLAVNNAKHKKMSQQAMDKAKAIATDIGGLPGTVPAAPSAPPPPPSAAGLVAKRSSVSTVKAGSRPTAVAKANPVTDLLQQIKSGTSLRKLDADTIKREREQRKGNFRQSVHMLRDMQETLREALDQRQLAMFSSDEDDDDYDAWDDDDDAYDD